jgi:hypothetical protein
VTHVFAVSILMGSQKHEPFHDNTRLSRVAVFKSPTFMVVSLRRKGMNISPESVNGEGIEHFLKVYCRTLKYRCRSVIRFTSKLLT